MIAALDNGLVKNSSGQHKRLNERDVLVAQAGYAQGYPRQLGISARTRSTPQFFIVEPSPNHLVSASASPGWVGSPTHATYPSGRINTAEGAGTAPSTGSSHTPR